MTVVSQAVERPRRTQEERSAETRARLMEATIDCLVDLGYARTTTTVVSDRAGVSRGAQLHHFPTKADLVTSAIEYLANRRGEDLLREAQERLSYGDRISAAIDLLAGSFSGPLFYAVLELWIAARTDSELRAKLLPLERRVGKSMRQLGEELFGQDFIKRPGFDGALQLTVHLLRGIALGRLLKEDESREAELLESWKWMVTQLLAANK